MNSEGHRRSSIGNAQDNENRESRSIRFNARLTEMDTRHLPIPPPPPSSPLVSPPPRRTSGSTRRASGISQQVPFAVISSLPVPSARISQSYPPPPLPPPPPPPPPPSAQVSQLPPALSPPRTSFSQPSTLRRVSISTANSQRRVSGSSQSAMPPRGGSLSETTGMPYDTGVPLERSSMANALRMLDDSYLSYTQARKKLYSRWYNEGQLSLAPGTGPTRPSFARGHSSVSANAWASTAGHPHSGHPGHSSIFSVMSHPVTANPVTVIPRICMGIVMFLVVMAMVNFLVLCMLVYHTS